MTEDARTQAPQQSQGFKLRVWHVAVIVLIAAAAIGVVVWLVTRDNGSSSSKSPLPTDVKAVPLSVQGLKTLARLGIVIYWAGEKPGTDLELRKTNDNKIYIRYLPSGEPIGSAKDFLTIGTYPMLNALAVTTKAAAKSGSVKVPAGKNAVAYYTTDKPLSVFIAAKGLRDQIEVYDPTPGRARELVTTHQIEPVK